MKITSYLPADWRDALLVGRLLLPAGPTPVLVRGGRVIDISRFAPTTAEALAQDGLASAPGQDLGDLADLDFTTAWDKTPGSRLLSPIDLQCIKASGVTFAVSAIERVIEERARGDAVRAGEIRAQLAARIGADLASVRPATPEAAKLKEALVADGVWSQYLEVAIGKDAEIFTKSPVLSSVGWGDWIGIRTDSAWNNPEPEIVMVCDPAGRAVGATLGNDVNLRDIEGRSALLLGKAKDNNASAALGPFIRLFDDGFTLDDVRAAEVGLEVRGEDGFVMTGSSSMHLISRDPLDLIGQTISPAHQYPDGVVLYLGTMFAPIDDRDAPGQGFTHHLGDRVRVHSQRLG
ncbi:MAG: fumarylacetoacetate hydrolase, partial [Caulobacteraceae bacterium]|nr:fumarylacetoacetate hydrolase [Caulobacteraceae bacterium]